MTVRDDAAVAFLVKGFPRLSETFVLHEFLELRRQGLPVRLVSLHRSAESLCHDEAAALLADVTYLAPVVAPLGSPRSGTRCAVTPSGLPGGWCG